jgi:hypothetical protein
MAGWRSGVLAWIGTVLVCLGCVRMKEPEQWECTANADCLAGEKCLSWGGYGLGTPSYCAPASDCNSYADCDSTQRCVSGTCVPLECTQSSVGACGGYLCDSSGSCRSGCGAWADCADGYRCGHGQCVDSSCATFGGTCPNNFACVNGTCPASCTAKADCASGYDCKNGACALVVDAGAAVPDAAAADAAQKTKVGESCISDTQCTTGHCCRWSGLYSVSLCETSCGKLPVAAPCSTDGDCLSGDCHSLGYCSKPCTTDDDCGANVFENVAAAHNHCDNSRCVPGCGGAGGVTDKACNNYAYANPTNPPLTCRQHQIYSEWYLCVL